MMKANLENTFELLQVVLVSENYEKALEKLESALNNSEVTEHLSQLKCYEINGPSTWKYSCYVFYLVSKVLQSIDLNAPHEIKMLETDQLNSIMHAVQECSVNSLELCVKKQQSRLSYNTTNQTEEDYMRLLSCIRMFTKFFNLDIICSNSLFDDSKLDYIVGVLAVIALKKNEEDVTECQKMLSKVPVMFSKCLVFKFFMMLKGFTGLSKDFQLLVHRELMSMIRSPGGFLVLCKSLLVKPDDLQTPLWQKCSMISKIIDAVVRIQRHQKFIIDEIFETLDVSLHNGELDVAGACVFVLKNLEEKNDPAMRKMIHTKILHPLEALAEPDILLCGAIIMDKPQLQLMMARLQSIFSPSSIASLPSIILEKHANVLFALLNAMPHSPESEKLASIIIVYMSNRDKRQLQDVIADLRFKDDPNCSKLHPRIVHKNETLQIGEEQSATRDDTETFLEMIKNSNNNFLIYDTFLSLINLMGGVQTSGDNFLSEYNVAEEDLPKVLHRKFFKKLAIIEPLQEMIHWKSLQSQLNEKPQDILLAVKGVLLKLVERSDSIDDHLIVIFFSLCKELISKLRQETQRKQMEKEFFSVKDKCRNIKVRQQLDEIFNVESEVSCIEPSLVGFEEAMKLMQSSEIYCKVYGSDMLIKLLKKRDKKSVLNRHAILAVALQNLKETESYAYLNIIRLLVALTCVMDSEVVDSLIAEYKNKDVEVDERLKTGEAIVKVTQSLGQMVVKFQDSLIRCFLNGSRDANNEFRASSLANVGSICKLLSYKVFNFFQEMLQQLEIIIQSDEYLPSKRAAAMVLSQILEGLPNLMDFQDFLLPIYRLLKDILANEHDPQTRIHAEISLEHLNAKTKDFLNPDLKVAKEIKIILDENPHKIDVIKFK